MYTAHNYQFLAFFTARQGRNASMVRFGMWDDAKAELAELEKIAAAVAADGSAGLNAAGDVLALAVLIARRGSPTESNTVPTPSFC